LTFAGGTFGAAAEWLGRQGELPPLRDVEMTFSRTAGSAPFSIQLQSGPQEHTSLTIEPAGQRVTLDRTQSGTRSFHRDFPARHTAPLRIADGALRLRFLLDASSLEVFGQEGETVLTELVIPAAGPRVLGLTSDGAAPRVEAIVIHALTSAATRR
jgi:sucrose-6-phosphate hydrolase SacC (GH32 family)